MTLDFLDREEEERPRLSAYSAKFYAGVRKALGENRGDISIQRGRFILQADLVFEPFTDAVTRMGRSVLNVMARGLGRTTEALPDDLRAGWVFALDVHSCASDLLGAKFPNAAELTAAQLKPIQKFFFEQGFVGNRVLFNAYGDSCPLDPRPSDRAFRKNRRIEFRLYDPAEPIPHEDVEPAAPKDEIGWDHIDHERERAGKLRAKTTGADVMAPPPEPKTMSLKDLHGPIGGPADETPPPASDRPAEEEEFNAFPHDFVLPGLEKYPSFKTGMAVFPQLELGPDDKPLKPRWGKSVIQHALETV